VTFILSEDEALRNLLKGMTVSDNKDSNRPVGVWFGQPDMETREQAYPYITIDLIDVSEATERVMVAEGVSPWYYGPIMTVPPENDDWAMPYPVPLNLDYQVTTFARDPRHDRQIIGQLVGNRLPFRFGSLTVEEFSETVGEDTTVNCTVRRLDMLGVAKRDTVEAGKRMFMNMITVRVSSEVPVPMLAKYYSKVQQVEITSKSTIYPKTLTDPSLQTTITISAPVGTP
jgi:hypothetical protein